MSWGRQLQLAARASPGRWLALLLLLTLVQACTAHRRSPPSAGGPPRLLDSGTASWYGPPFHGRATASGEIYDQHQLTAAHRTLPFGTLVEVRSRDTGRSVVVRINDRGPFKRGRIIDLSRAAAEALDMVGPGTARVDLYLVAGAPSETFTVQAGAFHDPQRAEGLRQQLAQTYSQVTVRNEGGWHRVYLGTFDHRSDAEQLSRELQRAGYAAFVTALP